MKSASEVGLVASLRKWEALITYSQRPPGELNRWNNEQKYSRDNSKIL